MATKTVKDDLVKWGDKLEDVQSRIEEVKAELKDLEAEETALYEKIMPNMKSRGLQSVTTTSGLTFYLNPGRVSFGISKMPGAKEEAVKWAMENFPGVLTIGAADLSKVCKPMLELPPFLERKQGEEYLSVR